MRYINTPHVSVKVSYENFQCPHPAFRDDEEPAYPDDDVEEKTEWG